MYKWSSYLILPFCTDIEGLNLLISEGIFSTAMRTNFFQLIRECEIRMSRKIIEKGYNIACLLRDYKNVDFRHNFTPKGDIMMPYYFDNFIYSPYELVFIKTNRGSMKSIRSFS